MYLENGLPLLTGFTRVPMAIAMLVRRAKLKKTLASVCPAIILTIIKISFKWVREEKFS